MKVILSHPYSGSLYWWFEQERSFSLSKNPSHSYYASLFGDVDSHLDVALTLALIYEEFVIPAADAVHPGVGDLAQLSPQDLGLEVSEWDPVQVARQLIEPVESEWQQDRELADLLAGRDEVDIHMELMYAVVDVLLAAEYQAPVFCSDGRRSVVRRLIDLGIVPVKSEVASQFASGSVASETVRSYTEVTGLTFGADNLQQFLDLKEMSPLRDYADKFQDVLGDAGDASALSFYEAIAEALESQALAEKVRGAFEATGHVTTFLNLLPVVGQLGAGVDLVSALGGSAAQARAEDASWFELSEAVSRARTKAALRQKLDELGL